MQSFATTELQTSPQLQVYNMTDLSAWDALRECLPHVGRLKFTEALSKPPARTIPILPVAETMSDRRRKKSKK